MMELKETKEMNAPSIINQQPTNIGNKHESSTSFTINLLEKRSGVRNSIRTVKEHLASIQTINEK